MAEVEANSRLAQVVQKIDPYSKLLRAWKLTGGISAQVTALEIERPDGHTQKMLVRRHNEAGLERNPQQAANEFKLLQLLCSTSLPAPAPYYLDQSGAIFSTPYLVIEYIEGQTEFAPANLSDFIHQFTTHLIRIHRLDYAQMDVSILPQQVERFAQKLRAYQTTPDESSDKARIQKALQAAWPIPQRNPSVLLHGDYWPGNVLWRDGRLAGIIDWEDATIGDPLADVANSRLEILWAFGLDAMQHFTQHYQSLTSIDPAGLPYWDLCAALKLATFAEWGLDEARERAMRERYQWFVEQALEKLPVQR